MEGKKNEKIKNAQVRQQQALVAQDGLVVDDDGRRGFGRLGERVRARVVVVFIECGGRVGLGERWRRVFVVAACSSLRRRRRRFSCCGGCPPPRSPGAPPLGLGLQVAVFFFRCEAGKEKREREFW
jgi:hypothetical protein